MLARQLQVGALLLGLAALTGCGIPTTGPRGERVELNAEVTVEPKRDAKLPYCLVPVTPEVAQVAFEHQPRLAGRLKAPRSGAYNVRLGVGDVISVTVFEAAAGGLFFPLEGGLRQGNFLTLPSQVIDNSGNITVPFAGAIRAAGRTASAIQADIVNRLKDRALEPQVVVTLVEQRAAQISVLGEVNRTLRYPASASPERVLDAVARAGGPRSPGFETWVLLERSGRIEIAPFEALIHEPENNIVVYPQDTLYLFREPQTFTAFGATGRQGHFPFEYWRLSVAEALGKVGGLVETLAEPSWVFLYRAERRKVVEKLDQRCAAIMEGPYIPVVYEINLRDPSTYFLATKFNMRNKDVLYVANARSVEATKFMNYIRTINSTVSDPIQTAIAGYTLKNLAQGTASATTVITAPAPIGP